MSSVMSSSDKHMAPAPNFQHTNIFTKCEPEEPVPPRGFGICHKEARARLDKLEQTGISISVTLTVGK